MRSDPTESAVIGDLDAFGAAYEIIECDPDLADTDAFCAHYGYDPAESANAILVASKRPPGRYALCLVLATSRLDVNRKVRDLLEVRKLSFASGEDTIAVTGMQIGGVTPFGLPTSIPVYVDGRIARLERAIIGGGSRSMKIRLDPEVFGRMEDVEIVTDLAVTDR